MAEIGRRHLLGGLAAGGGLVATNAVLATPQTIDMADLRKDADVACVYHCDFGDPGRVGQMITNINDRLSIYDHDPFRIKIVVVAHGQGIKPFLNNLEGTPWSKDAVSPDLFTPLRGTFEDEEISVRSRQEQRDRSGQGTRRAVHQAGGVGRCDGCGAARQGLCLPQGRLVERWREGIRSALRRRAPACRPQ